MGSCVIWEGQFVEDRPCGFARSLMTNHKGEGNFVCQIGMWKDSVCHGIRVIDEETEVGSFSSGKKQVDDEKKKKNIEESVYNPDVDSETFRAVDFARYLTSEY
jgi:hypothetical protein